MITTIIVGIVFVACLTGALLFVDLPHDSDRDYPKPPPYTGD